MLQQREWAHDVIVIGEDISRDEVISKYPEQKKVPIIIVNDNVLGGYAELIDYMNPPLDFVDDENPE